MKKFIAVLGFAAINTACAGTSYYTPPVLRSTATPSTIRCLQDGCDNSKRNVVMMPSGTLVSGYGPGWQMYQMRQLRRAASPRR
jgi:hypothetical protein